MDTPIVTQPRPRSYVSEESGQNFVVPEDLEYLGNQEEVRVYQQLDELDALCMKNAFDRSNSYCICNTKDEAFFFAKEISDTCGRICTNTRPFILDVTDDYGHHVMKLHRPYRFKAHWCVCCHLQEVDIHYPTNTVFARVEERCTPWLPELRVYTDNDRQLYIINGEYCGSKCFKSQAFHVYDHLGSKKAKVFKKSKSCSECIGLLNDFVVKYCPGLTAYEKLIILGAAFLVDFTYMEWRP